MIKFMLLLLPLNSGTSWLFTFMELSSSVSLVVEQGKFSIVINLGA